VSTTYQPTQTTGTEVGQALTRRWWVILLFGLIGAGMAAGAVLGMPQRYIGTVTLLVDIPTEANDTETLIRTVESLSTSTVVLADVASEADVDLSPREIDDRVTVERTAGSAVIEVSIVDTSQEQVRAIAEAMAPALEERLDDIGTTGEGIVPISVQPLGPDPYVRQISWQLVPTTILGGLAGLVVGALLVTVLAARRR
jgi:capsular polysaccharide biosynthesis protein